MLMFTQEQIPLLHESLVTSIACGDNKLYSLLTENVNQIWCMTGACSTDLQYLRTQLGLIELGQAFTRNMIDTAQSRMSMSAQDKFDGSNYKDAQAQRTSQGTSCAWSKATNFRQFQRDSEQHARAQSDSHSDTVGASSSYMYDRSQQAAGGWANSYDFANSISNSNGEGQSSSCTTKTSASKEGTPARPVVSSTAPGPASVDISWAVWFSIPFLGVDVQYPSSVTFQSNVGPGVIYPAEAPGVCSDPDSCDPIDSFGGSSNGTWSVSIPVPFAGALVFSFSDGKSARRQFTCSKGNSSVDGIGTSHSELKATSKSESHGETKTHDESETTHDRHKTASAQRDSEAGLHAGSSDTMRAHGESHSGSDSASHSEGQNSGQGTAWSKDHAESLGVGHSQQDSTAQTRYWSQIFKSLSDMWARVWDEIKVAERLGMASMGVKAGKMCAATMKAPCNPRAQDFSRRNNRPCPAPMFGAMPQAPVWGSGMAVLH